MRSSAAVRIDDRGTRSYKEHKHSTRRIDLASARSWPTPSPPPRTPGVQLYWYDEVS